MLARRRFWSRMTRGCSVAATEVGYAEEKVGTGEEHLRSLSERWN